MGFVEAELRVDVQTETEFEKVNLYGRVPEDQALGGQA